MPTQEIQTVDTSAQEALLARVDALLDNARNGREFLERTFMDIAIALDEVETSKAWLLVSHSYDGYIKGCEGRFGKSRTQLYGYRAVAKNLLPAVSKEQLLEMGISKAMPLAQYAKQKSGKVSDHLIGQALNPEVGVEEFRAEIAAASHTPLDEKGKWYEPFGGFYVSPEERAEFERVIALAREQASIPEDCPEWFQKKLIAQAMVMELLSSWGHTETVHVKEAI
jgi:hypothetical protein